MGPEKTEELPRGWTPMSCKGQVQQIKAWLKSQSMLSEDQKKKMAQENGKSPVEAPQASTSKKAPQKVPNEARGKGKGKAQVEQALTAELRDSHKREDSHGQRVQYDKNYDVIQKQGRGKIEPIFLKEVDLGKLVI
ncbi:hypothetical protein O181_044234 [Austropuccinia psidii MF-1]|uniref:Uncharacterized protein n=1 Tax=Austropuccinia psidii MF-1 TaxID=1389203 RepID=A0A9Q3HJ77_9BASI|nr:hypothetical protein [Austropuccinia psidii MF-1]